MRIQEFDQQMLNKNLDLLFFILWLAITLLCACVGTIFGFITDVRYESIHMLYGFVFGCLVGGIISLILLHIITKRIGVCLPPDDPVKKAITNRGGCCSFSSFFIQKIVLI